MMVATAAHQIDLDVAGLVRAVRIELELTQREFGLLLGVRQDRVSTWERGLKRPPLFKEQIIQAFDLALQRHPAGVPNLAGVLRRCGPAYSLFRVLELAYGADVV